MESTNRSWSSGKMEAEGRREGRANGRVGDTRRLYAYGQRFGRSKDVPGFRYPKTSAGTEPSEYLTHFSRSYSMKISNVQTEQHTKYVQ